MTFRAKLQQAIVVVVAGTTAGVLWVAQSQNSAAYQGMVDTLFEQQMDLFRREQDTQLATARKQAAQLASSVRLFAALEEGDPETYNVAADELRLAEFDFFRLASTQSGIMHPPEDSRSGQLADAQEKALVQQLTDYAKAIPEDLEEAQAGFVHLPDAQGKAQLHRVLGMQIRKFDQTVGTLFLGQNAARFMPESSRDNPQAPHVESALWSNGQAFGSRLPQALTHALAEKIKAGPESHQIRFSFRDQGIDHLVQLHLLNAGSRLPPAWLVSVFSLADLQARQQTLLWQIIGIGGVALLLASWAGGWFAGQLSRPIQDLVQATQEVRAGNLQVRLAQASSDELTQLNDSFNHMTEGLALKERYHSVLSMVADAKVAEQLISGSIQLGGELRKVTVIFCDIRGYTAFSTGRDPRDVIAVLNHHMGALTQIVYRWHGVINQFAGDAIMILFGAPTTHGPDAENAVRCAVEMLAERQRLNTEASYPLNIGIGIATGEVVAGCIGAEKRADYTVVGEHVNLAARLCSSAAAGEIVIDVATQALIPPTISTRTLAPLKLKGFSESIPAFQVLPTPSV